MITGNWTSPVFDRTQADVDFAKAKLKEWIDAESPEIHELKGCLNVSDVNRIEVNTLCLADILNYLGYSASVLTESWNSGMIPTSKDIKRIIDGIKHIIFVFYKPKNAPDLPENMLNFEEINAIEKNQYLLYELICIMQDSFKKSDTFVSGSKRILPLRR